MADAEFVRWVGVVVFLLWGAFAYLAGYDDGYTDGYTDGKK